MNALAKTDYASWSLSEAVVSDFIRKGAHLFDERLDPASCGELLGQIRAACRFDESLFVSEAEFDAGPGDAEAGPAPCHNLLSRLEPRLGFVERSPQVVEALWSLLGPDYQLVDRRVVCALPASALPAWLMRRVHDEALGDLDAYVRPERRDVAYRYRTDFRQDLIGSSERPADVVTLAVYLHPAGEQDAPIELLEGSHRMGASAFPHDLKPIGANSWRYRNGRFGEMYVTPRTLVGEAGFAALWHACSLNGAQPPSDHERISLRYLFARGEARTAGIDAVNASLAAPGA